MALELFFKPRLTELGKIKIGGKSAKVRQTAGGGTWRAPEKHDYFTITTLQRNGQGDLVPDAALMKQLAEQYGDPDGKLRQIPILALSNDIEDIMQSAWVWYGGRTVGGRSDGKLVTWHNDPANGKRLAQPREEDWKAEFAELRDGKGNKLFKLHTTLSVGIAAQQSQFGGVYKFRTTSGISGEQLYNSFMEVGRLTSGILVGMPLCLHVRPMQVNPKGADGRPVATTVYVVHVSLPAADIRQLQLEAIAQAKWQLENRDNLGRLQNHLRQALLPPGREGAEEQADINDEFQPETAAELGPEKDGNPDPLDAAPGSDLSPLPPGGLPKLTGPVEGELVDPETGEVVPDDPGMNVGAESESEFDAGKVLDKE